MTLPRTKAGGWGVLEKFTSAQANSLDINITNALDKTNGDILTGSVAIASTGSILLSAVGGVINAEVPGSIQASAAGSIFPSVAGGISTVQPSGILSNVAAGISTATAGGIAPTVAGGIASGVVGGIALTGGATDYPTFGGTPRSFTRCVPIVPAFLPSGWTGASNSFALVGGATTNLIYIPLPALWTGATLLSVSLNFFVGQAHTGVPLNMPSIAVIRRTVAAGVAVGQNLATSSPQLPPTPGSGAAWFSSGNDQLLTYTCNQNNVIDNAHQYFVVLQDEAGTNALSGNNYNGFVLSYSTSNMAMQ